MSNFVEVSAVSDAALFAKYQPVFDRIGVDALDRETRRVLPHEPLHWLAAAGFGAVRVPVESGGDGATLTQLVRLLIALAAADSAVPQALRGHVAFVEDRLYAPASPARDVWLARFVAGDIVGNAWTEIGGATGSTHTTRVERGATGWRLTGAKFYTTGSIFAQWIDVTATDDDGREVTALVATSAAGVTVSDDWDGFGQRLSGSGAAQFDHAVVADDHVFPFSDRFPYQTALYQTVLLAVLAGIAQAVERDASAEVRGRARVYSHGNAAATRDDPQVQQAVGQISARAYAAVATTLSVGAALQGAWEAHVHGDVDDDRKANVAAEIESAKGQIVVTDLVLRAATDLFDVLGASGVRSGKALDRHWRNARTVASHNPWLFKARIVGDWSVNATPPPFIWTLDDTPALTSGSPA